MTTMQGAEDYMRDYNDYREISHGFGGKMRYWVMAISKGRWVNCGNYGSENEAYEAITRTLSDKHAEVFATNTKDISEVNRRWKAKLLERHHNLDNATSPIIRKPAQKQKENVKPFGEGLF